MLKPPADLMREPVRELTQADITVELKIPKTRSAGLLRWWAL